MYVERNSHQHIGFDSLYGSNEEEGEYEGIEHDAPSRGEKRGNHEGTQTSQFRRNHENKDKEEDEDAGRNPVAVVRQWGKGDKEECH